MFVLKTTTLETCDLRQHGWLLRRCVCLFRLFTVLHFVGKSFLNLFGLTSVVKKYACGDKEEFVGGKRNRLDGDDAFVCETESLLYLFPELGDVEVRLAEYFLSVLQINFRYDGSTSTETSSSTRVEWSRFDNIFNNPRQLLAKYFLSVLQIDFRYAFPSNEG